MIRMVISSFYNTLIDKEEAIPTSTMLEIDKLRNKGITFSICTNRSKEDVLYYNHDYPFIDYILSYNGNYIYDISKDKIIYSKPLTKSIIKEIEKIYKDYKITYYEEDNKTYKLEIKVKKKDINLIDKLNNLDISKSIFTYNKEYFIEITSHSIIDGINKLKIPTTEIVSIIGNNSEKELINIIEKTYIVSNSSKELKEKSNYKTKSNNSHGVEQVIKKYNQ